MSEGVRGTARSRGRCAFEGLELNHKNSASVRLAQKILVGFACDYHLCMSQEYYSVVLLGGLVCIIRSLRDFKNVCTFFAEVDPMTLAFHALALSEAPERLEEVRVLAQVHTLLLLRSCGVGSLWCAAESSLCAAVLPTVIRRDEKRRLWTPETQILQAPCLIVSTSIDPTRISTS